MPRSLNLLMTLAGALSAGLGAADLTPTFPEQVKVFEVWELDLKGEGGGAWIHALPDDQVHDAWDADGDDRYARLEATLTHDDGTAITVPGFAMRDEPNGPWCWRVRWGPRRAGTYDLNLRFNVTGQGREHAIGIERQGAVTVVAEALPGGPLVMPTEDDPRAYLRELLPDSTSRATWLFGAWRGWVVQDGPVWPEAIDRERDLLTPMRAAGFNLLGQWHAPWEYQLVHRDRAEWWRDATGAWQRHPLPEGGAWQAWRCYDQGRAADFDRLVALCEGDAERPLVRLMLSPLPHGSFMVTEHPWGTSESGWSPENDGGRQPLHKLNGFSAFRGAMDVWDFFRAAPDGQEEWQRRLFAEQLNYFRYLVARWGASRALGIWVLADEVDGLGDAMGVMADGTGWWAHPEGDAWLRHVTRWFRGELPKPWGGGNFFGDPYRHPLHAAATSYGGQFEPGGNLEWTCGDAKGRPDLMGWHWYPFWPAADHPNDIWAYVIQGVHRYAEVARTRLAGGPVLISEFGAADRWDPADEPSRLYPSLYHFGIWSSLFSGQAGTVMDWDDGKEYGELCPRAGDGAFGAKRYPVDNAARLKVLRDFLGELGPEHLASHWQGNARVVVKGGDGNTVHALYDRRGCDLVVGWCFAPGGTCTLTPMGLAPGRYRSELVDPWNGQVVWSADRDIPEGGALSLPGTEALKVMRQGPAFPAETREAKGFDLAFRVRRIGDAAPEEDPAP